MNPIPLEVTDLQKSYGSVHALRGVSFAMEPGEVFGLLGPNGAGKTSLISILTTLESATSGSASVFGHAVGPATKPLLGCVPQEIVGHGFFTVEEVLGFVSGYYGIRNNQPRIRFLLERLGLGEHRKKLARQLSGGMKRRMLIAKALVHEPPLLLLDEPTAGVDVELRSSLWEFVRELHGRGTAVLLTTHYLEEAENLCDRVGVLHNGKLLRIGQTQELVESLTSRKVVFELSSPLAAPEHRFLTHATPTRLEFRVPNNVGVGDLLSEVGVTAAQLRDVELYEGTLEEAFRSLTESAGTKSA